MNRSCCLVLAFLFIPLKCKLEGCEGFPLDIGLGSSLGAAPSRGHGVGSRGAPSGTGTTVYCEALLSGADTGWVLRSTAQLKLCYRSEGKLCYCINTTDSYFA